MAFKLFVKGVVSSANYPGSYPNNVRKLDIIEVEEGLVVAIEFTAFDVESYYWASTCTFDHVTIKNGDGTTLMEKTCGSSLPAAVNGTSNTVEIHFHTDGSVSNSGWRLTWRAVTPGAQSSLRLSTSAWTLADLLA